MYEQAMSPGRSSDIDASNIICQPRCCRTSIVERDAAHTRKESTSEHSADTDSPKKEQEPKSTETKAESANSSLLKSDNRHVQQLDEDIAGTTPSASQLDPSIILQQSIPSTQDLSGMMRVGVQNSTGDSAVPKHQKTEDSRPEAVVYSYYEPSKLRGFSVEHESSTGQTSLDEVSRKTIQDQAQGPYISPRKSDYESAGAGFKQGALTPAPQTSQPMTPVSLERLDFWIRSHDSTEIPLAPGHGTKASITFCPMSNSNMGMQTDVSSQDGRASVDTSLNPDQMRTMAPGSASQPETRAAKKARLSQNSELSDSAHLTVHTSLPTLQDEAPSPPTSPLTSFSSDSDTSAVHVSKPKLIVKLKIKIDQADSDATSPSTSVNTRSNNFPLDSDHDISQEDVVGATPAVVNNDLTQAISADESNDLLPSPSRNTRTQPASTIRKSGRTLRNKQASGDDVLAESHAHQDDSLPDLQTSPKPKRGRKRKAQDDEFASAASQSSPELKKARQSKKAIKRQASRQPKPEPVDVQANKPEPFGQPPAWGDKRQQLCETLPYYRAYQSGAYTTAGKALGFAIDKWSGPRDKFTEEVIISRCGGGKELDENGNMVQVRDQETSSIALAFERSMKEKQPVGLIAGCGSSLSPSKLPHYYNVLDWFHVTDVWCEKSKGLKIWMVRFEKINLDEKSWWAPKDSPPLPEDRDFEGIRKPSRACLRCGKINRQIFNAGWVCLNTGCRRYFEFKVTPDDDKLDYDDTFMNERTKFTGLTPDPIAPLPLTNTDMEEMDAFGIEKECKRGIVCQKCQCCTRRVDWREWSCENPACDYTYQVRQIPIPIEEVVARSLGVSKPFKMRGGIRVAQMTLAQYDVVEYTIPGLGEDDIGFIRHFKANGIINKQPDGPNDLFIQMQERDFGLKRNPARLRGNAQEVLTSHWAANWGAPYKFGVSVLSKGFDVAPPVILKALQRLTWAGQQALTENMEQFHPFNELLSIGYFEDTKIGWHDDGEKELGPTVATLSLGAEATMSFRPKKKNGLGDPPRRQNGEKATVLQITLGHGDLVIMHGTQIQKLYDHMVEPHGKLRFALTCRYIRPETIANKEERQAAIIKGSLPPGSEKYLYDGDLNAKDIPRNGQLEKFNRDFNHLLANIHTGNVSDATVQSWIGKLSAVSSKSKPNE